MIIDDILLEYNVFNLDELTNKLINLASIINDKPIIAKFVKLVKREAINNLQFLQRMTTLPPESPEWARKALDANELYKFVLTPNMKEQLEHVVHYIVALVQNVKNPPSQANPDYTFLQQQYLESKTILNNLEHINLNDLIDKSNEYFKRASRNSDHDDDGTETIINFPDGYKWVKLIEDVAFSREGKVLQNCIGSFYTKNSCAKNGQIIIVLKDNRNESHVAVRIKGSKIYEMQGKNNRPPIEKYIPYCIKLINEYNLFLDDDAQRGFIKAGYYYDKNSRKILDIKTTFVPELINDLGNGFSLYDSKLPKIVIEAQYPAYYTFTEKLKKYYIKHNDTVVIDLLVSGDELTKLVSISNSISSIILQELLTTVINVLKIKSINSSISNTLSQHGLYIKNQTTIVSLTELLTPNKILKIKSGEWLSYEISNYTYNVHKQVPVIKTIIDTYGTINIPSIIYYYTIENNVKLVIFSTTSNEIIDLRYIDKSWNGDISILNVVLPPLMKHKSLKFSNKLPTNIIYDKDHNKFEDINIINKLDEIAKTPVGSWYKIPDVNKNDTSKTYGYSKYLNNNSDPKNYIPSFYNIDAHYDGYILTKTYPIIKSNGSLAKGNMLGVIFISNKNINDIFFSKDIGWYDFNPNILKPLVDKLKLQNMHSTVSNNSNMPKKYTLENGKIINIIKELTTDLATTINNLKIYKISKDKKHLLQTLFTSTLPATREFLFIVSGDDFKFDGSTPYGAMGISKNKITSVYPSTSNNLSREELVKLSYEVASKLKLETGKDRTLISVDSTMHQMLDYIKDNPGSPRSGWFVKKLKRDPQSMPSFTNKSSLDARAVTLGLITPRDSGRKESTYQLRLTPLGEKIIDKLNNGKDVLYTDI